MGRCDINCAVSVTLCERQEGQNVTRDRESVEMSKSKELQGRAEGTDSYSEVKMK